MKILPFPSDHIPSAADLLAKHFSGLIEKFPLLPERTTELETAQPFLTAIIKNPNAQGMIALDGDQVIGYMLGSYGINLPTL